MNQAALQFDDDGYPVGFFHWLRQNGRIWRRFEQMALEMAMTGRTRYSARTIIETLRWNTDLSDTDQQFKINGNHVPGLARYWMEKHGERFPGFFQMRDSLGKDL